MSRARIVALAGGRPATTLDDDALARLLGVDAAHVLNLSRGLTRSCAADGEGPSNLAAPLATAALATAGVAAADVGLIVFATTTPDLTFPGSACLLQALLGVKDQGCVDVRSQCTGFLTALDVAARFVVTGAYERVLVATGDVPTHVNRYDGESPELAILTGDGAAVALLERGNGRGELLSTVARIDGKRYRDFWCEFPASRHLVRRNAARGERVTREAFETGGLYPRADFAALRKSALEELPKVLDEALGNAGVKRADALLVAHVDPAVEDALAESLSSRAGRVVRRRGAYSFGSTLPLMLADAEQSGELRAGETIALATAGAGASWGAAVIKW